MESEKAEKKPLQRLEGSASFGPLAPAASAPPFPLWAWLSRTASFWTCLAYLLISGGLILVNRSILVDDGFRYPLTVSFMGMFSSAVFSYAACKRYGFQSAQDKVDRHLYVRSIMPIGFCMATTLCLGNMVYLHLSVSLIQMLKATTPVMVMIALFAAKMETPSRQLVASVLLIAVGAAIASAGQVNLSVLGLTIMLAAELLEAVKLVLMQKLLVGLEFHPIEGLMYLAPACCFWLGLELLLFEAGPIVASGALMLPLRRPITYLFASVMGFCVNYLAYAVIKMSSSLMLKILGTVRSALIVCIGTFWMLEGTSALQFLGYALSLVGFFAYTRTRQQQAVAGAQAMLKQQQQAGSRPGSIINVR